MAATVGLIAAPVARLHARPDRRSEQVSLGLLGDPVTILARAGGWTHVRTPDGYEGWAGARDVVPVPAGWGPPFCQVEPPWANLRYRPDSMVAVRMIAFAGVRLPLVAREGNWTGLRLPDGAVGWTEGHRVSPWPGNRPDPPPGDAAIASARCFLGVPYLWGGCTPLGLDCSGFVQLVWRLHGFPLPRDARDQARLGTAVPLDELAPADLLFFGSECDGAAHVTHVAIALDPRRMIHAPSGDAVRIDRRVHPDYDPIALFARRLTGLG